MKQFNIESKDKKRKKKNKTQISQLFSALSPRKTAAAS